MSSNVNDEEVLDSEQKTKPMYELTRKILLAAIGALALGIDEIDEYITRLVERGELAQKEGCTLKKEVVDRIDKAKKANIEDASKRFQDFVTRLNVPSKKDITDLSEKIAELTKKVENLSDE